MALDWKDALLQTPPEGELLMIVEDVDGDEGAGSIFAGFYAEGEYHLGNSMAGDPLADDQTVIYWAVPNWPAGYGAGFPDENGYKRFDLDNGHAYFARQLAEGVLVDPRLPRNFDNTPNEERQGHEKYWGLPFIVTEDITSLDACYLRRTDEYAAQALKYWQDEGRAAWMKAWPSGTRYETRCLDGGAWDRSTSWGMFPTLAEAIQCAKTR